MSLHCSHWPRGYRQQAWKPEELKPIIPATNMLHFATLITSSWNTGCRNNGLGEDNESNRRCLQKQTDLHAVLSIGVSGPGDIHRCDRSAGKTWRGPDRGGTLLLRSIGRWICHSKSHAGGPGERDYCQEIARGREGAAPARRGDPAGVDGVLQSHARIWIGEVRW